MIDARYRTAAALALLSALWIVPSAAEPVYGPWYSQPPLQGTGPGLYYSYHPDHVPGYPQDLRGYPVPLYSTSGRTVHRYAAGYGNGRSAHVDWCQRKWRTYRASDNSYQPIYGQRRLCRSPYL
jgi:hypothetical protein